MQGVRSSYTEHKYGEILQSIIIKHKPLCIVELGILDGYSTFHISQAIKFHNPDATFQAYDLFEDYKYKHGVKEDVEDMLIDNAVVDYVDIIKGDAYKVYDDYADSSVDFLHIDISNTGKIIRDLLELWHPKISEGGLIVIEGGSRERDDVDWMKKYNHPPIKLELETNPIIKEHYDYITYLNFPSMTVLTKRESQDSSSFMYGKGW